jgi:putative addiction module component (TIGR02574 family)
MDLETTLTEVFKLPLADRISLIQRVLDNIAGEIEYFDDSTFPPEYFAELDRRIADDDANPERAIPWELVEAESAARELP